MDVHTHSLQQRPRALRSHSPQNRLYRLFLLFICGLFNDAHLAPNDEVINNVSEIMHKDAVVA
jgi:hypothetical protein